MKKLIKETTRKERVELAKRAFGVATSDGVAPSDIATKLVKKYIDGEMELEQVKKELLQFYNKNR